MTDKEDEGYGAVAPRVEPPETESGEGFESLPAPPIKREWVELTDDEGADIWGDAHDIDWNRLVTPKEIVKRISDKLKEKNT